ncbi:YfiR family protein [Methylomonas koyamae]|uniref:YfiR family protein n=1 Tax=Methylomonas koyamae TaxID=702114 RepID=UPI0021B2367B|nr:YfiR family protein [Methylomonas koyamae]
MSARRAGALLVLPLIFLHSAFAAETANEAAVKVAFLYNFFKFIEWPDAASQNKFNLCLVSPHNLGDNLLALEGKTVNGKPLAVLQDVASKDLKACHLVYIAKSAAGAGEIARDLRGAPVVTVSDKPGFLEQNGTIGLVQDGNRLNFEVNLDNANAANIRISAQLLKLARNLNLNK